MEVNKYYNQQKTTTENWVIESTKKFNSKFDYSKVEITNSDTKVTIICPIHGEFKMTKHNHVNSKHGCLQCVKDIQKQERLDNQQNKFEEFKDKVYKKFNSESDVIEIIECEYTTALKSPCTSKCNICNTETKWNSIQLLFDHQSGCKFCVQEKEAFRQIDRMRESTNKWKAKCKIKFNDNFEYNFEYSGKDDIIEITCKKHGAFKTTREAHEYNPTGACSKCSPLINVKSKEERKTLHLERIFENIKNKNKNINIIGFQYNESNDIKLLTYCIDCENYTTYNQFNNFINSRVNCTRCYQNSRIEKSTKEFIKNASIKFKNKFDYSKVEIDYSDNNVTIICPDHGEFEILPSIHLNSDYGCRVCSGFEITTEDFIKRIESKYPNNFIFDKVNYVNQLANIVITCKQHGDLLTIPKLIIDSGCPYCVREKMFNVGYLYSFKLKTDNDLWKIGVTMNSLNDRYSSTQDRELINYDTAKLYKFDNVYKAYKIEKQILEKFKNFRLLSNSSTLLSTGNSEIISIDPEKYIKYLLLLDEKIDKDLLRFNFHNKINFAEYAETLNFKYSTICDLKYKFEYYLIEKYNIVVNYIIPNYNIHKINTHKYLKLKHYDKRIITIYSTNDFDKNISMIKNIFRLNENKIYARNCEVREINSNISTKFIDKYHLQNSRNSKICLGLFYNNELIQVMTFGHLLYHAVKNNVEIHRLVSKSNLTVVGGASKLLKYFERKYHDQYNSIITYADSSFSEGNVYNKLGFTRSHDSAFGYFYVHNNGNVLSRYQATKSNIKSYYKNKINDIKKYDDSKTELINMEMNGYIKIIIPKQLCYIKTLKKTNSNII